MIYKSKQKKIYERNIETMGMGLALFNIHSSIKRIGMNYHMFFENENPPLDLAINPEDNFVEYISFFIQDEKISYKKFMQEIIFCNESV